MHLPEKKDAAGGNEVRFCSVEFKASSKDPGVIEGFASTYEKDLYDDIIHPGAFTKTINERVNKGRVPLFDSHVWSGSSTLGTVESAEERDGKGLFFTARLSKAASVQDIKTKMLEGILKFLSIGLSVTKGTWEEIVNDDGSRNWIRHIHELKLWEVSVVPIPANEGASITMLKSFLRPSHDRVLLDALSGRGDVDQLEKSIQTFVDQLPVGERLAYLKALATRLEPDKGAPCEPEDSPLDTDEVNRRRKEAMIQYEMLCASMDGESNA